MHTYILQRNFITIHRWVTNPHPILSNKKKHMLSLQLVINDHIKIEVYFGTYLQHKRLGS